MAEDRKTDFYAGKARSLPRFVYRRLLEALRAAPERREQAIAAALAELCSEADPALRKFKFTLPAELKAALSPAELERFRAETRALRESAAQVKLAYPHVSDEFTLDREFLASVLDLGAGPRLRHGASFYTMGSCFAQNIARFLHASGQRAQAFALSEGLNSPMSNAYILGLLESSPAAQFASIAGWRRELFPEASEQEVQAATALLHGKVATLAANLRAADCIVLTLGNIVDFFREGPQSPKPLLDKVVPKFVAMKSSEDEDVRSGVAQRLKRHGAAMRLASSAETAEAVAACIRGIRALSAAPLVVTVSPVPVDSVVGLSGSLLNSAIEVDCVSKSRLRSAFDEFMLAARAEDPQLYYFPSFEIVRWIAPGLPIPSFGQEDAAARHVSAPILGAICELFLSDYVAFASGREPEAASLGRKLSYSFSLSPRKP